MWLDSSRDPASEPAPFVARVLRSGGPIGSVLTGLAVWAVLVAAALWISPIRPTALWQWALFIILGPIAFLALQALGELAAEALHRMPPIRQMRTAVLRRTADESFSGLRIVYLLGEMLLIGTAILALAWLLGWWPE